MTRPVTTRTFDVAVLGGGPAALFAALHAARRVDVALVADRLPTQEDARRVDAVPAGFLTALIDMGIHPHRVGVHHLHAERWVAWDREAPRPIRGALSAHLERPRLDCALWAVALEHPRIRTFLSNAWDTAGGVVRGDGWHARRLIDATGRAAVTAASVVRPAHPWAARTFLLQDPADARRPGFALAALPDGYVYRIASQDSVAVGFVGRGGAVEGTATELSARVRERGAGWVIDDLAPLATFREGPGCTSSIQWTSPSALDNASRPVRIGEAALARDPLSSQGLSAAAAEAVMAASIEAGEHPVRLECYQSAERQNHLAAMAQVIDGCRFAREPAWRAYAAFIAGGAALRRTHGSPVVRVTRHDRHPVEV